MAAWKFIGYISAFSNHNIYVPSSSQFRIFVHIKIEILYWKMKKKHFKKTRFVSLKRWSFLFLMSVICHRNLKCGPLELKLGKELLMITLYIIWLPPPPKESCLSVFVRLKPVGSSLFYSIQAWLKISERVPLQNVKESAVSLQDGTRSLIYHHIILCSSGFSKWVF